MTIQEMKNSNLLILEAIVGSTMYGTNIATSDKDITGLFLLPNSDWLSLIEPTQELNTDGNNVKYYELKKFMKLLTTANPTVTELLFVPDDCILYKSNKYDLLKENRLIFITKKVYYSYSSYAYAQIKKAKGQNKKVHNVDKMVNQLGITMLREGIKAGDLTVEWLENRFGSNFTKFIMKDVHNVVVNNLDWKEMDKCLDIDAIKSMMKPKRNDYIYFVQDVMQVFSAFPILRFGQTKIMPFRPVKLDSMEGYDVASVEHVSGLYRLYKNGQGIKFMNDEMVCTSIPIEREWKDFVGVVYFNLDGYKKECKEWDSFWEWMCNRNESRWSTDWKEDMEFDCKNMYHTMRLMFEAEHILKEGFPKVRWDGEKLKFLMDIRNGKYEYDFLLKQAETKMVELKKEYESSKLPDQVNMKKVNQLYKDLISV